MAWALQSDAKETLLDVCASQQSMWPEIRGLGVGFWFTDAVPLRKKVRVSLILILKLLIATIHLPSGSFADILKCKSCGYLVLEMGHNAFAFLFISVLSFEVNAVAYIWLI